MRGQINFNARLEAQKIGARFSQIEKDKFFKSAPHPVINLPHI